MTKQHTNTKQKTPYHFFFSEPYATHEETRSRPSLDAWGYSPDPMKNTNRPDPHAAVPSASEPRPAKPPSHQFLPRYVSPIFKKKKTQAGKRKKIWMGISLS